MIRVLLVTMNMLPEIGQPQPVATFDTYAECSAALLTVEYDANCVGEDEMLTSPRPRPRPTERTE